MHRIRFNLRTLLVTMTLLPASLWFVWMTFRILGRFAAVLLVVWFVFVACGLGTCLISRRSSD
jgi:hypothetical protein